MFPAKSTTVDQQPRRVCVMWSADDEGYVGGAQTNPLPRTPGGRAANTPRKANLSAGYPKRMLPPPKNARESADEEALRAYFASEDMRRLEMDVSKERRNRLHVICDHLEEASPPPRRPRHPSIRLGPAQRGSPPTADCTPTDMYPLGCILLRSGR